MDAYELLITKEEQLANLNQAKALSADRERVGIFLYRFAWVIEIFAITIGVAIAFMTMASSFNEMQNYTDTGLGFSEYTSIFIAAVPFIMVAVVEATKIPFVEAYYKTTNLIWKSVFGTSLIFIALITFESAINGFERNFNALMYGVDKFKKELVNVEEKIPPLEVQRENLSLFTSEKIEKNYSERSKQISQQRQEKVTLIQDRIKSLRASTRTEYVASLREQRDGKKLELETIYRNRNSALASLEASNKQSLENASSELSSQRRTLQTQLTQAQKRLGDMELVARKEIDDASIFTSNSVEKKWREELDKQEKFVTETRNQLNSLNSTSQNRLIQEAYRREVTETKDNFQVYIDKLNDGISKLNIEISKSVSSKEREIEALVLQHQQELKAVEVLFFNQQKEIKSIRDSDFEKLATNGLEIQNLDEQILSLKNERVELRNLINVKVGDNQIYRMAQWFFGKESAADIDRQEVVIIASFWFGSLAFLIAFTGIILALGSFVIRDTSIADRGDKNVSNSSFSKLMNQFRRWIYYGKKMQRKPTVHVETKEVIKEVPIEKIVFRDKPIEIIKKELVHVPLYTNDINLLRISGEVSDEKLNTKEVNNHEER